MKRGAELKRTPFARSGPKPATGKPKMRKCQNRACRRAFEVDQRQPFVTWCDDDCAVAIASEKLAKMKAAKKRHERAQDKAKLEKFKTLAAYKKEAQAAWNSYVRARDLGLSCASCGAMPGEVYGGSMDCSHYRSRGSAPHLAFHLHNAASACVKCNRFLGGNVVALRAGLVERIGEAKILAVEADQRPRHFTKEYLIRIKKIFTKKAKRKRERYAHT